MRTFITYDMLRGEQVEIGENQTLAAKVQEELGEKNRNKIVERPSRY